MVVFKQLFHGLVEEVKPGFNVLFVPLHLSFLSLLDSQSLVRFYDRFELKTPVHLLSVLEMPFAAHVPLLREKVLPVREELFAVLESL